MKYYIVYDGRALEDTDNAMVLETLGEMKEKNAIKTFRKDWADTDAVLFEYTSKGDQLTDETFVDSIY